ncbi:MAG TPA: gliding motility-associated C-terminal domain-containing protein [Dinghuibacter sp.]|uniref:T9SS type B sorting domain-containing protein n=1 Tax=Dinghuibacter sp. TaxID=2024697 RepID=UPI002C6C71D3|nr:gliding motility-associated C-terminal domain-containing protein [Dinghuibacter sp.]HTJ11406.1 gliding motility-associated C-terminal domain-containing protein [Dinghuibacter sp.]
MPRLSPWLALLTTALTFCVPAAAQVGQIDSLKVTGAFSVDIVFTGPTCGSANGTIAIMPSAGTAPYQYSLDGGAAKNQGIFYGVPAGAHTLLTIDASGRRVTTPVTLVSMFSSPTATVGAYTAPSACLASDAMVTLNVSGGAPPYAFSMDQVNYQAGNVFNDLPNGQYYFFVRDANGCTTKVNGPLQYNYNCTLIPQGVYVSYSQGACGNNGYIDIEPVTAGEPWPYTFSTDGVNFQHTNTLPNLSPGLTRVYVKDASDNEFMEAVVIYPNCVVLTPTLVTPDCGSVNGAIIAQASMGTPPYAYSLDGGATFQYSPVFGGLAPGTYKLFAKDANGQLAGMDVSLGSGCLSIAAVSVNGRCGVPDGSVTGRPTGGFPPYEYSLDGSPFQNSNIFTGLGAGSYTITVRDSRGVIASTVIPLSVSPAPSLTLTGTTVSCKNNDGTITAVASGGLAPYTYSPDGVHFVVGGIISSLDTGLHKVWTMDAAGCTASDTLTLRVLDDVTVDAGSAATICQGGGTRLAGASNAPRVAWSPATGLTQTASLSPVASPSVTTVYTLTATNGVCVDSDSVKIMVNPAPIAVAGPRAAVCYGGSGQLHGGGGVQYLWSPAAGLSDTRTADPVVQGLTQTTTYSLNVIDANGCTSLAPSTVTVTVDPPAPLFAGDDTTVATGQPVPLSARDVDNTGFTSFVWSPPDGLSNPMIAAPVAQPTASVRYTVTATTPAGCEGVAAVTIKVFRGPDIYVPGAFTPNGDGVNDVLRIVPVGIKDFKEFLVVDRWGKTVFRTANPDVVWDGARAPAGVYVWMVAGIDVNGGLVQKRGTVVLIR